MTASARAAQVRLATALIFITPAMWSVNYLVARWAIGEIAPHMLALGRWCVRRCCSARSAGASWWPSAHLIRAEAGQFIVLGALGMWVCGAFVYIGGRSTLAVNIGLIYAASPVLIALASACGCARRSASSRRSACCWP